MVSSEKRRHCCATHGPGRPRAPDGMPGPNIFPRLNRPAGDLRGAMPVACGRAQEIPSDRVFEGARGRTGSDIVAGDKKRPGTRPGPVQQGGNASTRENSSCGVTFELGSVTESFKEDSLKLVQCRYAIFAYLTKRSGIFRRPRLLFAFCDRQ